tara:strand:- start:296 stop:1237 length:942 start_codon:yes stop_codon:yes gene_type:complete
MIKKIYRKIQTFIIPKEIKKNFLEISKENIDLLTNKIKEIYIPTISKNISDEKLLSEIEEHVESRIFIDRTRVVPWLSKNINLDNLHILEIGCGTGSSSITLAEQGANVLGIDIHKESLDIAKLRSRLYGLDIEFLELSSIDIHKLGQKFDAIILYATLEHLTIEERLLTLERSKEILNKGGYIITIEAPNRLWYFDSHTSELPFFQWLPDNLAYRYSKFSPKETFSSNYLDSNYDHLTNFLRRGRGVSYHEFELIFEDLSKLNVISRLNRLVFTKSYINTFFLKPLYKFFLKKQIKIPKAFYDEYLDFIIKL